MPARTRKTATRKPRKPRAKAKPASVIPQIDAAKVLAEAKAAEQRRAAEPTKPTAPLAPGMIEGALTCRKCGMVCVYVVKEECVGAALWGTRPCHRCDGFARGQWRRV